jgi:hypothetical protein
VAQTERSDGTFTCAAREYRGLRSVWSLFPHGHYPPEKDLHTFSSPISGCGSLWEAWRRDLEIGMESCVIGYTHAETAEPGEQAETRVRFRDMIGLLAINLHDAGEVPPQRREPGRTPEGARCSIHGLRLE